MDVAEEALKIKLKIAELKARQAVVQGQLSGINSELNSLSRIKCPTCKGAGYINFVNPEKMTITESCKDCDQSGYLAGERPQGW
jgi:DnaJ-class molecular chaperone